MCYLCDVGYYKFSPNDGGTGDVSVKVDSWGYVLYNKQAQICPVCAGSGKVWENKSWDDGASCDQIECHGCGGKGWVIV